MTGSAFTAMTVVVACFSVEVGGLEDGGLEIHPDGRHADSFFMSFQCRFSGRFSSHVFIWLHMTSSGDVSQASLCSLFGVLRGIMLAPFLIILQCFHEKGEPSFLYTITTFWLDFQGLGPPQTAKKQKKGLFH